MSGHTPLWRRLRARLVAGVSAPLLLQLTGTCFADPPPVALLPPAHAQPAHAQAALPPLDLYAARARALANNPRVAAATQTLAAAEARARALDNLHLPRPLAPDLPVRRKQSCLGVEIAQAGLAKAEWEVIYGVTYSYLSVLYASEQHRLTEEILNRLAQLEKDIKQAIDAGSTRVSQRDLDEIHTNQALARARQVQADVGREKALSALRDALGVPPGCAVGLLEGALPRLTPALDRHALIEAALARRGELAQADLIARVTALEVCAQEDVRLNPSVKTFASGSDIHAQAIPPGSYSGDYVPGAVGIEMPAFLNGNRQDRIKQARIYADRANTVAEQARRLVALETEQAYLSWQEASRKRAQLDEAIETARTVLRTRQDSYTQTLRPGFRPNPRRTYASLGEVLSAGRQVSELRGEANQALYEELLALALLEKATAGGFCADFPAVPAPPAPRQGGEGAEPKGDADSNGAVGVPETAGPGVARPTSLPNGGGPHTTAQGGGS